MTVLEERIKIDMADENTKCLDEWFERLERMPVPEGFKVEIVGGNVYIVPQRDIHWHTISAILCALKDRFGRGVRVFSDVRIDFPGDQNGFCPDIALLKDSAKPDDEGRWRHQDVGFVAEVISEGTTANDYGPKKTAYAVAEIPVYLIADPYKRRCTVHTEPKGGAYQCELRVDYGADVDMTATPLDLTLRTDKFPRD